jgi:hypothetical protein
VLGSGEKMKIILGLLTAAMLALAIGGCSSAKVNNNIEIKNAPIDEVTINRLKSNPPQISVYIKGGLSDGCTTFHDLTWKRDGDTITITVTVVRPKDKICPAIYTYFEKDVNLGTDFTVGATYTVQVNDVTRTFTM